MAYLVYDVSGNGDMRDRPPPLRSDLGAILRRGAVKGQLDRAAARKAAARRALRARGVRARQPLRPGRGDWWRLWW